MDMASYMRDRRSTRRSQLIELAGGCCIRCGAVTDLQFDHRERSTKLFVLSGYHLDKAWSKILEEFEKCDLLCGPCHLDKTRAAGDSGGGWNRITEHGTEAMHRAHGCNCPPCCAAARAARIARGELSGTQGPKLNNGV